MTELTGISKINGVPAQCKMYCYRSDTGELVGSTMSDPTTGAYTLSNLPSYVTLNVVAMPPDSEPGLAPQAAGPFEVEGVSPSYLSSGYLFQTMSSSGSHYREDHDKLATDGANWDAYFAETLNIDDAENRIRYSIGNGSMSSLPWLTSNYPGFNKGWTIYLSSSCGCWSGDDNDADFEFLDSGGNVIAAIRTRPDGTYRSGLWYGPNLSSLTKAPQSGSYPNTAGDLTFTTSSMVFTNTKGSNYNGSWTLGGIDVDSIVSIRATMLSESNYTGGNGCSAGTYMRVTALT